MKITILVSAALLTLATNGAMAQPGNPNCQTNWIGGACGVTTNGGHYSPVVEQRYPEPKKPKCEHPETTEPKAS